LIHCAGAEVVREQSTAKVVDAKRISAIIADLEYVHLSCTIEMWKRHTRTFVKNSLRCLIGLSRSRKW